MKKSHRLRSRTVIADLDGSRDAGTSFAFNLCTECSSLSGRQAVGTNEILLCGVETLRK